GRGHAELAPAAELRRCPKCDMKLWPAAQARPLRFHDIRHTTASLLIMAGADLPAVQIMRHTDPRITTEFYAHLAPGYLRSAIDRLAINLPRYRKRTRGGCGFDAGTTPGGFRKSAADAVC